MKDLFLSDILSEADYERLQEARKAGVSIEKWCKLYEDISKEKLRRTGKAGNPSQADVSAALEKSRLTEAQKDVIWNGYGWKGERGEYERALENVSESDTSERLEGLKLPELPRLSE